jgi:hypothetical protein
LLFVELALHGLGRGARPVQLGQALVGHLRDGSHRPGELVAIRGPKPAYDAFWRRPNNCEEPVLLALSRQKGWVLPLDGVDAARLADVMRRGARLYVETMPGALSPEVEAWLASHARLVATTSNARIFRLAGD